MEFYQREQERVFCSIFIPQADVRPVFHLPRLPIVVFNRTDVTQARAIL